MKKLQEMSQELQSKVAIGVPKESVHELIQLMDARSKELLDFMGFQEGTPEKISIRPIEKVEVDTEKIDANPKNYLLFLANSAMKYVYDKVLYELGMYCHDMRASTIIKFNIRLLSYGNFGSSDSSPVEREVERVRVLDFLKTFGFVLNKDNKFPFHRNRKPFERYFKAIGAKSVEFSVKNGNIIDVNVALSISDVEKWVAPEPEKKPESAFFDESEVYHMHNVLRSFSSVLSYLSSSNDTDTSFYLIRSYNAEVQQIAGVNFELRKSIERQHKESRAANIAARNSIFNVGDYMLQHYKQNFSSYYYDIDDALSTCMEQIGFYVMDLTLREHGSMSFEIFQSHDEQEVEQIVYTKRFHEDAENAIRQFLPSATIRAVRIKENSIFNVFEVITDKFQDIETLFQCAKSIGSE